MFFAHGERKFGLHGCSVEFAGAIALPCQFQLQTQKFCFRVHSMLQEQGARQNPYQPVAKAATWTRMIDNISYK